MGSTVVRGEVEGTVEFTGAETFFGKTAALLVGTNEYSNLQKILIKIVIVLVAMSLILCSIVFIYLLIQGVYVLGQYVFVRVLHLFVNNNILLQYFHRRVHRTYECVNAYIIYSVFYPSPCLTIDSNCYFYVFLRKFYNMICYWYCCDTNV